MKTADTLFTEYQQLADEAFLVLEQLSIAYEKSPTEGNKRLRDDAQATLDKIQQDIAGLRSGSRN